MTRKSALITGITGQDGSYLAPFLLEKGYRVHGLIRRSSSSNTGRIDTIVRDAQASEDDFKLHHGDLSDAHSVLRVVQTVEPDEIYNLGAQSHVHASFGSPEDTSDCNALGVLRVLEAIRAAGLTERTKFYQASTSELYGAVKELPQSETTPLQPRSPYAIAKLYGYWITVCYRDGYGMHASNGIMFNHESPRRGSNFVTRKITRAVAAIARGLQDDVRLGNLDSKRDWGHARDYVEGMWLVLQRDQPDDYVFATGEQHSVREFVEQAFACVGHNIEWRGTGFDEVGVDRERGTVLARVDPRYFRPTEVSNLVGDASKARRELGWAPRTSFAELVREMVEADLANAAANGVSDPL